MDNEKKQFPSISGPEAPNQPEVPSSEPEGYIVEEPPSWLDAQPAAAEMPAPVVTAPAEAPQATETLESIDTLPTETLEETAADESKEHLFNTNQLNDAGAARRMVSVLTEQDKRKKLNQMLK